MKRIATSAGDLARRGFGSVDRALAATASLDERVGEPAESWLDLAAAAADPDQALSLLVDLAAAPALVAELSSDRAWLERVVAVLGASNVLGRHLAQHPADLVALREPPRRWSLDELVADLASCTDADQLRRANRRHLARIAASDLTAADPALVVDQVAAELADLADAVVRTGLALVTAETEHADRVRLGVVALGKCGAQELNYVSDVDVLFVAEPADEQISVAEALRVGIELAAGVSRLCAAHTAAGTIWPLDAALRPEGKAGPLVRTLESMRTYYEQWASNWEFQAMLKARPMAGDLDLAQAFVDLVQPLVWAASERPHFLAETRAMRQRVISLLPRHQADREIKLSSGGLRDTEFTVQLLQLVHGRVDERLRSRATLVSLQRLVDHGYIGRADGAELASAYRLQRVLEHRAQLHQLRRTHLLPDDDAGLRRLARLTGQTHADDVVATWRTSARRVRVLHQRIFYSPLLEAISAIRRDALTLSDDHARDRLRFLGFVDPDAATRHIKALTEGTTRAAEIQRQLMPAMLGWLAEAPHPDAGLLAFRQVSEALRTSPWYLRALRDEGQLAHRLGLLLSSSRYAVDLLKRSPDAVQLMGDDAELVPRHVADLTDAVQRLVARHTEVEEAGRALRALRRRELLRIATADLLGLADLATVGHGLSDLTSVTLDGALAIVQASLPEAPQVGVIAMGRWGGAEMSYGSDADSIFVVEDCDGEGLALAGQVVARVRALLSAPGPDPQLSVDADLRPEGRSGPMVRTVSAMQTYYERWADTWEIHALIRARYGAGAVAPVQAVLDHVEGLRHPTDGLTRAQLADIRKLKARMEAERLPWGTDPKRNLKLGPGGLSDVEWTVQVLQLQHSGRHPALRVTGTMAALDAAAAADLIGGADAARLREAWELASEIRNAVVLANRRPSDAIPHDADDLASVAHLIDRDVTSAADLLEQWARAARLASHVVDRVFWGRA